MIRDSIKFVFFGSSDFSVFVLEELRAHNLLPSLIITTPDKPKGRKLVLTPNVVKLWAQENKIEVLDPASLRNNPDLVSYLASLKSSFFLVASYGKIIPEEIFDIPEHKTLNIHPSLLPKYRGASPIQSQILNDEKEIGVSIMIITEGMDEGPIVAITPLTPLTLRGEPEKPALFGRKELEKLLAIEGARLFAHTLPEWLQGVINPIPQNDNLATYCKKIKKEDGEIDLKGDPYQNFLKIKAFEEWPGTYFFFDTLKQSGGGTERKRIIIKEATFENEELKILKVLPEGRKEMSYGDFLRGFNK